MVGHYDSYFEAISPAVIMNTTSQSEIAGPVGQNMAEFSAEGDEVRFVVSLHMRQISTIELHGEIVP